MVKGGRCRNPVPDPYRDVAYDAGAGSGYPIVVQLHRFLPHLRVQSFQLGPGLVKRRLRLVERLLADHFRLVQAAVAVEFLLVPHQFGFLGFDRVFLGFQGGLLLGRINLHQGRSGGDAGAGVHENVGDLAFDLRHDHGGFARLQGGDVLRGVVYRDQLGGFDFDRDPGRTLGLGPADRASATGHAYRRQRQNCR